MDLNLELLFYLVFFPRILLHDILIAFWHISSFSFKKLNLSQLHLNIDIRRWTQVEQLERQVVELREALVAKQEQENAMLQVISSLV